MSTVGVLGFGKRASMQAQAKMLLDASVAASEPNVPTTNQPLINLLKRQNDRLGKAGFVTDKERRRFVKIATGTGLFLWAFVIAHTFPNPSVLNVVVSTIGVLYAYTIALVFFIKHRAGVMSNQVNFYLPITSLL